MNSRRVVDEIAEEEGLDAIAIPWQAAVARVYELMGAPGRAVAGLLHGRWLGHPLHPAIVHWPLGAFGLAAIFDAFSRHAVPRQAADLCILVGLISVVPVALSGSTDYHQYTDLRSRRLGAAHGAANVLASLLYLASYLLRLNDVRPLALLAAYGGFLALMGGGYLGGLMVYERRLGTNHAGEPDPEGYLPTIRLDDLSENQPVRVEVGDTVAVVVRQGDRVFAFADACAHQGASLSEGGVVGGCLQCPWHGSRFELSTGRPVDGPSAYHQPMLRSRVRNGVVEVGLPPNTSDVFPMPNGEASLR